MAGAFRTRARKSDVRIRDVKKDKEKENRIKKKSLTQGQALEWVKESAILTCK